AGVPGPLRRLVAACLREDPAERPPAARAAARFADRLPAYGSWLPAPLLTEILWRAEWALAADAVLPTDRHRPSAPDGAEKGPGEPGGSGSATGDGPPRGARTSRRRVLAWAAGAGALAVAGGGTALWAAAGDRPRWRYAAGSGLWRPVAVDARTRTVMAVDTEFGLHGVDAATGDRRWYRSGTAPPSSWLGCDGRGRVVLQANRMLVCLDAERGSVLWSHAEIQAAEAVCDARYAYVTITERGGEEVAQLIAYDLRDGARVWDVDWYGSSSPGATLHRDAVLVRLAGTDLCLDAATGQRRWSRSIDERTAASPVGGGDLAWVTTRSGDVFGLDLATGRTRVTGLTSGRGDIDGSSRPAFADGTVIVCTTAHEVCAVDAATGTSRWRVRPDPHPGSDGIDTTPLIHDGTVYTGTGGDAVVALDLRTGRERWRFRTPRAVDSSPALLDGLLFFGCFDGGLYAVDATHGPD
ncbi:PQQ-binding-like beta-propeller repeat protein, partial [Streptomyces sp. NPDC127110]|uniref:PQQ-binding-like beta-propeller repeat protein n=1 Tax=Streptomyces sp. NPDC127110 TaxID=3345362 RepID=UPI003638E86F